MSLIIAIKNTTVLSLLQIYMMDSNDIKGFKIHIKLLTHIIMDEYHKILHQDTIYQGIIVP